jgi:pimeloyl-ACP methyl ester carboxylesterase
MATFVLVHGANHGGWCWQRVAGPLRASGHEVYAPSLTGLGDRVHLLNHDIGLETHAQDVVNLLFYEDLREVILVGHSYGGAVIQVAGDRMADRVAHLIHFDSIVPLDGESVMDIITPDRRDGMESLAERHGDGWLLPAGRGIERLGITDPDDIAWMEARLVPHPLKCMRDKARLTGAYAGIPKTYISCTRKLLASPSAIPPWERTPVWRYRELATGHDAMITDVPGTLAIFEEVAATLS